MKTFILIPLICACLALAAQEKPPTAATSTKTMPTASASSSVLTPTRQQLADMRVAQLQFALAQKEVQAAIDSFVAVCNQTKAENNWPKDATCNLQDLSIHPPAPQAASVAKPDDSKK